MKKKILFQTVLVLGFLSLAACGDGQPTVVYTNLATPTAPAGQNTTTLVTNNITTPPQSPTATVWNFDNDTPNALPKGITNFSGQWVIRAEAGTPSNPNALCQIGQATFPTLQLSEEVYTNFTFSTRFKPISGKEDQAGGLIFRIQDANNFYIVRANALENSVNLYKFAGGNRSEIKGADSPVKNNIWQELKVEVIGSNIKWSLDGKLLGEIEDSTYSAGKLGLWTKADSVTCFDDVQVNRL